MFHLAHGGCLHRVLLTHIGIDGCSMSYPGFHIAHGGLLRPIDFARGYGIPSTTLLKPSLSSEFGLFNLAHGTNIYL